MMAELAGLKVEPFGPLDALYAAVRRCAPQVAVTRARVPEQYTIPILGTVGVLALRLHVSYRDRPARRIRWDEGAETYVWASGPDCRVQLPADPEQAAMRVDRALGAGVPGRDRAGAAGGRGRCWFPTKRVRYGALPIAGQWAGWPEALRLD